MNKSRKKLQVHIKVVAGRETVSWLKEQAIISQCWGGGYE
jgi:hypothetical protein